MCFGASLPNELKECQPDVRIRHANETLLYSSSRRTVEISLDLLVANEASTVIFLNLTHPDNVVGSLGTKDWVTRRDAHSEIISLIYQDNWRFDPASGDLIYRDPFLDLESPVPWSLLDNAELVDATSTLDLDSSDDQSKLQFRPYTRFKLGPFPPHSHRLVRLRVEIATDSYDRLVGSQKDIWVYGPERILNYVNTFELDMFARYNSRVHSLYRNDFSDEVFSSQIVPESYHVVLLQSEIPGDRLVMSRATSASISEAYISDPSAKDRALWFNAIRQDFSLVLRYGSSSAVGRDRFCRRVAIAS